MNYYIVATRKAGKQEHEITHYEYNEDKSELGDVILKENFWDKVKYTFENDHFYSLNHEKDTIIECEWYHLKESGENFLKSDPNGTEKDNLLKLPDC